MANLKDIKRRITSVKKTRQITSAMKLVAGAKLRKATENAVSARPYQQQLSEVLSRVAAKAGAEVSDPLLEQRATVNKTLIFVLTSDRGLCGPFNNTLLRRTIDFLSDKGDVDVVVYGRKGSDFCKSRKIEMLDAVIGYGTTPVMELVRNVCDRAVTGFGDGTYDEVYLVSNDFVNVITQVPTFSRLLPMEVAAAEGGGDGPDYDYEPSAQEVLARLLPLFLRTKVLQAFLETEAGQHAARMTAMDNATRNASDLIDKLTLDYNRARQAAITTEIIEIVSGAQAL